MGLFGRGKAKDPYGREALIAQNEAMVERAGATAQREAAAGRWAEALTFSDISLQAVQALARFEPGDPRHIHGEAAVLYFHASALGRNGRVDEAIAAAERAAELYRRLQPHNPGKYNQLVADADGRAERWRAVLAGGAVDAPATEAPAAAAPEEDVADTYDSAVEILGDVALSLITERPLSPKEERGLSAIGITPVGAGSTRARLARFHNTIADRLSAEDPDDDWSVQGLRVHAHDLFVEASEAQEMEMRTGIGDYGLEWARTLLFLAKGERESADDDDTYLLEEYCGWLAGVLGQLRPYAITDGPTAELVQEADAFLQEVGDW
jgi:tetratricopeptide (TPR) repeat protein